jgi:Flp pilus assembly protein TadD
MLRTSLWILGGLLAATLGVKGVGELRAREEAARLRSEAVSVLQAPFGRVPDLGRVDATRARALLGDALALHADATTEGLAALAEALEEFQKARPARADAALLRAQKALPDDALLEVLAGSLALDRRDAADAAKHAKAALALRAGDRRARLLAADAAIDLGETLRAGELLAGLIADEPAVGMLYNRRGLCREKQGDLAGARADFERASTLDPSMPQPFINLGRLLRDEGRAREAEQAFATAIERGSAESQAWLGRGLSRIAQGDVTGGALDVQHARELAPAEPAPLIALGDVDVMHDRLDDAVARYRAAVALAADDAIAWLKLGNALARARKYDEARPAFERAIAAQPELAAAHNGLGAALMGLGDVENAEKAFSTAATLDARDPNPLLNLALLHGRRGDQRAARDLREQAAARAHESRVN